MTATAANGARARTGALLAALTLVAGCVATPAGPPSLSAQSTANTSPTLPHACVSNPLGERALYLRGTFNSWTAPQAHHFTYFCNRFELVTALVGAQTFKVADEDWSANADWGASQFVLNRPLPLVERGAGMTHTFSPHQHKFVVSMSDSTNLTVTPCPAPPLGDATLFLRGSMNNFGALESYAFQYSCDGYYLNVRLNGKHTFKIADAKWLDALTFGAHPGGRETPSHDQAQGIGRATDAGGVADVSFSFDGDHTIKLAFNGSEPVLTVGALSFADPSAQPVTDTVALSTRYDSRSLEHKAPFGAITAGTSIAFNLDSLPGIAKATLVIEKRRLEGNQEVLEYNEIARVPMLANAQTNRTGWTANYRFDAPAIYGYWFDLEIAGKHYAYQNNTDAVHWTREKGTSGIGSIGPKPELHKGIRRFRQTVYAADFVVPDWAKDAVYYYIFPDRFRNGNRANDPKPGATRYQDKDVEFHANWLDKPYKPNTGDGSDAIYNNDFFGGDLAGIIEKLDYIAALGANTIYMTPIFAASSNHKYDTADYKTVDPSFGSNDDFTRLTAEAAKRGIRVVPDASLNHTGSDSIYFDRFGKYGGSGAFANARINAASPYADWYTFDATKAEPDKQFRGWVGVLDLPELNKASTSYRQYAYGAADSVTRTWLNRGAAGWRMDVAPWVPDDFWREWRKAVKATKPDAVTIAETWFDSSKYFLGDTFDSTMNYIFRNSLLEYANGGSAKAFAAQLELMREAYPPQAFYALMNLLSTHDQARSLHVFGWNKDDTDESAIARAKARLRMAVFFQMTFPGSPSVYYGDEVGVTGGDDPYNRATYPWADLGGKPDLALLDDFKALIALRNTHPVLRRGSIDAPAFVDEQVIAHVRRLGEHVAITATNNSDAPRVVTMKLAGMDGVALVNVIDKTTTSVGNGTLTFTVPAQFGVLWVGTTKSRDE